MATIDEFAAAQRMGLDVAQVRVALPGTSSVRVTWVLSVAGPVVPRLATP